jgi:predicted nucleic acid-binding protein
MRNLVLQHDVKGVQVHDARLAAGMIVHGIKSILTYNPRDFKRYAQIQVVHPAEVIA